MPDTTHSPKGSPASDLFAKIVSLDIEVALANVLLNADITTLEQARELILTGELRPGSRRGYGIKRHREVCALVGIPNVERPRTRCAHCGQLMPLANKEFTDAAKP